MRMRGRGEVRKRCWACNYGVGGFRGARAAAATARSFGQSCERHLLAKAACTLLCLSPRRDRWRAGARGVHVRSIFVLEPAYGAGRCSRRDRQRWRRRQRRACTIVTGTGTAAANAATAANFRSPADGATRTHAHGAGTPPPSQIREPYGHAHIASFLNSHRRCRTYKLKI